MCCQQNDGEPQRKSYLRSFTVSADRGFFISFLICKRFNFDSESSRRCNDRFEKTWKLFESLYVPGKLPTYPSPKPTFCPKWGVSVNVDLGEGWVGSFPETYELKKKELMVENLKTISYFES